LFTVPPGSQGAILSPVLSDLITLRLDEKARMVDRKWYDDQRGKGGSQEAEYHELFFGTGGSFAVRLPAYDLIEKVKARWTREMIHAFLMGETRGELAFSAQFADDPGLPGNPAALVSGFLLGDWTGLPYKYKLEAPAPKALRALGLSLENRFQSIDVLSGQSDEKAVGAYLDAVLNLILMGTTHEETTKPRAGKIGYAHEFLEEIKKTCEGELNRVVESSEAWPNPDIQTIAGETKSILQGHVAKRLEQLNSVQENLGQVYSLIVQREAALVEWQSEMDQLHGRLYLWQELVGQGGQPLTEPRDLADTWYEIAYQRAQPEIDAQKYLGWSLDSVDVLQLQLKLGSAQDSTPSISAPEQFADELLAFASKRVQILWDQHADLSSLADQALALLVRRSGQELGDMNQTIYSNVEQWLQAKAAPASDAHNMFSQVKTHGSLMKRTMLARRKFTDGPTKATFAALEQVMLDKDETQSRSQLPASLDLSDPLSWQFVRTVDLLNPAALRRYDRILNQLLEEDEGRTVFDWEATAKRLRGAFGKNLLHPVVAAGLVDVERARLYSLAFASGWVTEHEGEWGIRPVLGDTSLAAWKPTSGWNAGVYGLLHFVYRADSSQVNEVKNKLDQNISTLRDLWERKARQEAWQQFEAGDSADVRSLKLLAWYAMRKRIGELT